LSFRFIAGCEVDGNVDTMTRMVLDSEHSRGLAESEGGLILACKGRRERAEVRGMKVGQRLNLTDHRRRKAIRVAITRETLAEMSDPTT